jgi:hypothetical protein
MEEIVSLPDEDTFLRRLLLATAVFGGRNGGDLSVRQMHRKRRPAIMAAHILIAEELYSKQFEPNMKTHQKGGSIAKNNGNSKAGQLGQLWAETENFALVIPFGLGDKGTAVLYHDHLRPNHFVDSLERPCLIASPANWGRISSGPGIIPSYGKPKMPWIKKPPHGRPDGMDGDHHGG